MTKYIYTVWFRNNDMSADDPDHEWPACFIIDGTTASSAKDWADGLSRRYAGQHHQGFLRSSTETLEYSNLPGTDSLPVIIQGQDAGEEKIGW